MVLRECAIPESKTSKRPLNRRKTDPLVEDTPVKLSKIHFLIHPGFIGDPEEIDDSPSQARKTARMMFKRYLKKAEIMEKDSIMVAFLHLRTEDLLGGLLCGDEFCKLMLRNLRALKKTIGSRLIVLCSRFDVFGDGNGRADAIDTIREIADSRGFTFDSDVESEVFGETLGCCVDDAAEWLNRSAGFTKKTIVDPFFSNLDTPGGHRAQDLIRYAREIATMRVAVKLELSKTEAAALGC